MKQSVNVSTDFSCFLFNCNDTLANVIFYGYLALLA